MVMSSLLCFVVLCCFAGALAAASLSHEEEVFIKWFNAKGGKNEGVVLNNFDDMGRGVLAKDDVFIGEQVLFIPNEILLARDLLLKSGDPIHRRIAHAFSGSESAVVAALLLEVVRGEKSAWKPYVDLLPRYVPNLSHFSAQMLQELDDADLMADALTHQREITNAYAAFINQASPFWPVEMTVSLEQYRWATSIIDSRGLRFKGQVVLAPFADMFNYAPNNVPREQAMGSFFLQHHILGAAGLSITADHDCERGEQLLEDYGDNSDSIYITYHGFVPHTNPFRCVNVALPEPLSLGRRTRELLELLQFKRAPSTCTALTATPLAGQTAAPKKAVFHPGFVAYATVMSMNHSELETCVDSVGSGTADKSAYWKRVFRACGFDAAGLLLERLMGQAEWPSAPAQLDREALATRTAETLHQVLVSGMGQRHAGGLAASPQGSVAEQVRALRALHAADKEQLSGLQVALDREYTALASPLAAIGSGGQVNRTLVHQELAVRYRVAVQREWLRLIGAVDLQEHGLLPASEAVGRDAAAPETAHVLNTSTVVEVTPTHTITTTTVTTQTILPVSELNQQLAAFNEWVAAASPTVLNIAAVELPLPYRVGTVATADVKAEEVYLTTPTSIIIDNEKARADPEVGPLLRALEARFKGKDDFHELLLYLVYQKFVLGAESPFYPYLRLLPALHQLGSPVLWTEADIRARLQPSHTVAQAVDERRRTLKTFEMIGNIELISKFFARLQRARGVDREYLSLDNYQWAAAILNSRAIWWEGQRHLVPLLDFINCEEGPDPTRVHSTTLSADRREAVTLAGSDVAKGQQLFENYGQPNHMYFMWHGFSLDSNTHDCVHSEFNLTAAEMRGLDWAKAKPIVTRLGIRRERAEQQGATVAACLKTQPAVPEQVWLALSLKMGTYEELLKTRRMGLITAPAAAVLRDIVVGRLADYASASSAHTGAFRFLQSEVVMLQAVRAYLEEYIQDQQEL